MAEQDLIRFLSKISQLQSLADRVQQDPSSRERLAACADHNQVVQLAQSWDSTLVGAGGSVSLSLEGKPTCWRPLALLWVRNQPRCWRLLRPGDCC